jgi:hypothetical protein
MKGVNIGTSCRAIFKQLKSLTVNSLYIFEVLYYFLNYNLYSTRNSDLCEYDMKRKDDFHVSN